MATEKRPIDAHDLWSDIMMLPHNGDMISSEEVEQTIMEAPTVDAVEVVRCKDCISYKPYYLPGLHKNDNCGICDRYPFLSEDHKFRTETDFCSFGERRTDD